MNNNTILRLEGAALLLVSLGLYYVNDFSWWLFACLILLPDISLIGYVKDSTLGAFIYNVFHSKVGPAVLFTLGNLVYIDIALPISLIWFCHINFDRMVGIGLKEVRGFNYTHLGLLKK
jgi:hypothetical protein